MSHAASSNQMSILFAKQLYQVNTEDNHFLQHAGGALNIASIDNSFKEDSTICPPSTSIELSPEGGYHSKM